MGAELSFEQNGGGRTNRMAEGNEEVEKTSEVKHLPSSVAPSVRSMSSSSRFAPAASKLPNVRDRFVRDTSPATSHRSSSTVSRARPSSRLSTSLTDFHAVRSSSIVSEHQRHSRPSSFFPSRRRRQFTRQASTASLDSSIVAKLTCRTCTRESLEESPVFRCSSCKRQYHRGHEPKLKSEVLRKLVSHDITVLTPGEDGFQCRSCLNSRLESLRNRPERVVTKEISPKEETAQMLLQDDSPFAAFDEPLPKRRRVDPAEELSPTLEVNKVRLPLGASTICQDVAGPTPCLSSPPKSSEMKLSTRSEIKPLDQDSVTIVTTTSAKLPASVANNTSRTEKIGISSTAQSLANEPPAEQHASQTSKSEPASQIDTGGQYSESIRPDFPLLSLRDRTPTNDTQEIDQVLSDALRMMQRSASIDQSASRSGGKLIGLRKHRLSHESPSDRASKKHKVDTPSPQQQHGQDIYSVPDDEADLKTSGQRVDQPCAGISGSPSKGTFDKKHAPAPGQPLDLSLQAKPAHRSLQLAVSSTPKASPASNEADAPLRPSLPSTTAPLEASVQSCPATSMPKEDHRATPAQSSQHRSTSMAPPPLAAPLRKPGSSIKLSKHLPKQRPTSVECSNCGIIFLTRSDRNLCRQCGPSNTDAFSDTTSLVGSPASTPARSVSNPSPTSIAARQARKTLLEREITLVESSASPPPSSERKRGRQAAPGLGNINSRTEEAALTLIGMALIQAPGHRLTTHAIAKWVVSNVPSYISGEPYNTYKRSVAYTKFEGRLASVISAHRHDSLKVGRAEWYWYRTRHRQSDTTSEKNIWWEIIPDTRRQWFAWDPATRAPSTTEFHFNDDDHPEVISISSDQDEKLVRLPELPLSGVLASKTVDIEHVMLDVDERQDKAGEQEMNTNAPVRSTVDTGIQTDIPDMNQSAQPLAEPRMPAAMSDVGVQVSLPVIVLPAESQDPNQHDSGATTVTPSIASPKAELSGPIQSVSSRRGWDDPLLIEALLQRDVPGKIRTSRRLLDLVPQRPLMDRAAKQAEIAARPSRKMMFGYEPLRSRLGQLAPDDPKMHLIKPRATKVSDSVDASPAKRKRYRFDPLPDDLGSQSQEGPRIVNSIEDFFDFPSNPIPTLDSAKQLAFRDGTRDLEGQLPRAKVLYSTGYGL